MSNDQISQPEIKSIILSQYIATLSMLKNVITKCPEAAWDDDKYKNRFWRVAYHTIFYTDLYLSQSLSEFRPWEKHQSEINYLGFAPGNPPREAKSGNPYNKDEILEYFALCEKNLEHKILPIDLKTASGFEWLPFNKLELQFYNIRHIQHHTAQLIERMRQDAGESINWVGKGNR